MIIAFKINHPRPLLVFPQNNLEQKCEKYPSRYREPIVSLLLGTITTWPGFSPIKHLTLVNYDTRANFLVSMTLESHLTSVKCLLDWLQRSHAKIDLTFYFGIWNRVSLVVDQMQLLLDYLGSILSNGKDFYFKKIKRRIEHSKRSKLKKILRPKNHPTLGSP